MSSHRPATTTVSLLIVAMFLFAYAGTAEASILVNGSFEYGPDPMTSYPVGIPYTALDGGSTAITGWLVLGGQWAIDYGNSWIPSDGTRSIDLNGTSPGGIAQTFSTTPGWEYLVNFDMAGNPEGPPTVKEMRVSAAGDYADFTFDVTGKTLTNMGWLTRSWSFVATGTSTTLEFTSLTLTGNEEWGAAYGPALDNVIVTEIGAVVAEPTALAIWGMISGMGLVAAWRRRRQSA